MGNAIGQYPVSYTHLDVYKRQGYDNLSKMGVLEKSTLLNAFHEIIDGWRRVDDPAELVERIQRENIGGKKCRLACQTKVEGDVTVAPF